MAWYEKIRSKYNGEDREEEIKMYLTDFMDYGFKIVINEKFFDSDFKVKKRVNYVNSQFYRGFDIYLQKDQSDKVFSHQIEFFGSLATLLERLNDNFKFTVKEVRFSSQFLFISILAYSPEDEVDFLDMFDL